MLRNPIFKLLLILGLFYIVLVVVHTQIGLGEFGLTDDLYFQKWTRESSYIDWITLRYTTFNGRLLADSAVYLVYHNSLWLWRLLNPAIFCLLGYTLARYAARPEEPTVLRSTVIVAFTLLGLSAGSIITEAAFSINGTLTYLWPAAAGLFALLPIWDRVVHQRLTRLNLLHYLAGTYAVLSQEQMALFVLGCMLVLNVLYRLQTRRISSEFIGQFILLAAGALIMFASPGNPIRYSWSAAMYYPGFEQLSVGTRILLGFPYLFTSLVNLHWTLLLIFCLLAVALLAAQSNRRWLRLALVVLLSAAGIVLLLSRDVTHSTNISRWLLDFEHLLAYNTQLAVITSFHGGDFYRSLLSMGFWGAVYAVGVPLVLYQAFGQNRIHLLAMMTLYFAGVCTLVSMFFSPTIHESGERTRFFFTVVWIILLIALARKLTDRSFQSQFRYQMLFIPIPAALLLTFGLIANDFSLATLLPEQNTRIDRQMVCSIDVINTKFPLSEVHGWGYYRDQDPASYQRFLVLRAADHSYHLTTNQYLRPELNEQSENGRSYQHAGFFAYINLLDLPDGQYELLVGLQDKKQNTLNLCETGKMIESVSSAVP